MIKTLFNQGLKISAIAKELKLDRKTVRKYINTDSSPKYERKIIKSKLDEYREYIKQRLERYNLTSYKLYEEIQKQGFTGKYGIVNNFVQKLKKELKHKAVLRFETLPG